MNNIIKAKPTTYKNIRFRSKTEAQVAVALDRTPMVYDWTYEPTSKAERWSPDFQVWFNKSTDLNFMIEVKPVYPSTEYWKWLKTESKVYWENKELATVVLLIMKETRDIYILYPDYGLSGREKCYARFAASSFLTNFSQPWRQSDHYRFDLSK